jgi:hypothetical protein
MAILIVGLAVLPRIAMADRTAPIECLDTARLLLSYLLNGKTDIGNDNDSQSRWLSTELRRELKKKQRAVDVEVKRRPTEKILSPSNADFLLAWEPPSACTIIGSRRYGNIVFVDVEFRWGKGKNYEGNRRLQSYIFIYENGKWKLDDVYSAREAYAPPGNLSREFRSRP